MTTRSKWKQIHVKGEGCTSPEHGSKLHVITNRALYEIVARVNRQNSETIHVMSLERSRMRTCEMYRTCSMERSLETWAEEPGTRECMEKENE